MSSHKKPIPIQHTPKKPPPRSSSSSHKGPAKPSLSNKSKSGYKSLGGTTPNKKRTSGGGSGWTRIGIVAIAVLVLVGAILGIVAGVDKGVFSSSSSSSSLSSNGGGGGGGGGWGPDAVAYLNYDFTLQSDFTDLSQQTTASLVDPSAGGIDSCVPSFPVVLVPNGQYRGVFYNPCDTQDEGVLVSASANLSPSFTFSGVFQPSNAKTQGSTMFFGSKSTPGVPYYLTYSFDAQTMSAGVGTSGFFVSPFSYQMTPNVWMHVVLTYDSSAGVGTIYIDGQQMASTSVTSAAASTWGKTADDVARAATILGGYQGGAYDFVGYMYNLRSFNIPLSADQVSTLLQADTVDLAGTSPNQNGGGGGGSSTGGGSSIYTGAWYNNNALLLYHLALISSYSDSSGHAVASITASYGSSGCNPDFSPTTLASGHGNTAWYNGCDEPVQGILLNGAALSDSFSQSGFFYFSPDKTNPTFMFFGCNRQGYNITTQLVQLGHYLQYDFTTGQFEAALTYEAFWVADYTYTFTASTWTHVVLTVDNTQLLASLYLNGQLISTYGISTKGASLWTSGVTDNNVSPIILGGYNGDGCETSNCDFTGYMYAQRGFNVALPAAQVAELYQQDLAIVS